MNCPYCNYTESHQPYALSDVRECNRCGGSFFFLAEEKKNMITICNTTTDHRNICDYEISISGVQSPITFQHARSEGIAALFLRAANACHRNETAFKNMTIERMRDEAGELADQMAELKAKYDELKHRMDGLEK